MSVYTCIGDPRYDLADLERSAAENETNGTINSKAMPGDGVLFYWTSPVSAINARGVVLTRPTKNADPGDYWEGKYFADIGEIVMLPRPLHIRELRARWPDWG